jgi:hypothetical protein
MNIPNIGRGTFALPTFIKKLVALRAPLSAIAAILAANVSYLASGLRDVNLFEMKQLIR